jgi:intracellular septation protein A
MERIDLIKQMLPGILPLFIFIIADGIWGSKVGLITAVAVGLIELAVTWFREKRIERFIIADVLLLTLMAGISILLDNDIFFKLKPALVQSILCIILAMSAFSSKNLLAAMSGRMLKNMPEEIKEFQIHQMKIMARIMLLPLVLHTALIVYSALYMSKETWVFISGGLFYIILAVMAVGYAARMKFLVKRGKK